MSNSANSWSTITQYRREYVEKFGEILSIPVLNLSKEQENIIGLSNEILDIGAGKAKPLKKLTEKYHKNYYSLDADLEGDFDYNNFNEIPEEKNFDLIIANQLLEHLTFQEVQDFIIKTYNNLSVGGNLFITVPNMAHPVRYWADITHILHIPLGDLYGLLGENGFSIIKVGRSNKYPLTKNPLKKWIINFICKTFRIDWCDTVLLIAQKVEN